MSLTREQKQDLIQLNEYLRKIEKLSTENTIDLDVFMTDYRDDGYSFYSTEKIHRRENSGKRKDVFQNEGKEKQPDTRNQRAK